MTTRAERAHRASSKKDDEYFTLFADIAAELPNYEEQLKGKRVLCPCDWDEAFAETLVWKDGQLVKSGTLFDDGEHVKDIDLTKTDPELVEKLGETSCNFIKFLLSHASEYGIKSISASGYFPETGEGVRFQDIDYAPYDVIITNPPFSQFREFISTLIENDKKFLVIGPQHAITYKDFFHLIKENKVWLGYHYHLTGFQKPDGTIIPKNDNLPRTCCWWTNLDVSYRHKDLILTERYDPDIYSKYINYDAINVPETRAIPDDYAGEMGVPITFLQKYNPEQFEIIGQSRELGHPMSEFAKKGEYMGGGIRFYTTNLTVSDIQRGYKYHCEYDRIVVKNRKLVNHDA